MSYWRKKTIEKTWCLRLSFLRNRLWDEDCVLGFYWRVPWDPHLKGVRKQVRADGPRRRWTAANTQADTDLQILELGWPFRVIFLYGAQPLCLLTRTTSPQKLAIGAGLLWAGRDLGRRAVLSAPSQSPEREPGSTAQHLLRLACWWGYLFVSRSPPIYHFELISD